MNNLTLVIMAAGMGSRFGGLKQIEPVGPNNEIIADYSVYDAIKAGFKKVIFIIRKENLKYFQENITKKYQDKIEVLFAFQELENIPQEIKLPKDRTKMLGTAHALYCARNLINGNFVLINSDDFYGFDSYKIAVDFFENSNDNYEYVSINYPYKITESKNGAVKRGVVVENNGFIKDIIESEIKKENDKLIARSLTNDKTFEINEDTLVSVNFFGIKKTFLNYLDEKFNTFIKKDIGLNDEFLIPNVIKEGIKEKRFKVISKKSKSKWMGVTYKEDLPELKIKIKELIKKGEYPENLWK